jgi:hypothetical protein
MAWHLAGFEIVPALPGGLPKFRPKALPRHAGGPMTWSALWGAGDRSRQTRRMAARGRPAHPLRNGRAQPRRISRRPSAGSSDGSGRLAAPGDRQLAISSPRPGEDGSSKGMLLGYARVSTIDQNPALQRDALAEAGCGRIFTEQLSGAARIDQLCATRWNSRAAATR